MIKGHTSPTRLSQWRRSLPVKFILIQLAVAVIIIVTSVWFLKSTEYARLIESQQALNINVGKAITASLQRKTDRIESLAVSIGALGELYQHTPKQLNNSVPALLDQIGQQAVIIGGGVWPAPSAAVDPNSHFWARDPNGKLIKKEGYDQVDGTHYSLASWYLPTQFYPADTTYWSKSYIDPVTHDAMLTASVPMWSEHQFIGVATVDIALASLNDFFKTALTSQKGYVFALDQQNRMLSYPDLEHNFEKTKLFQPFEKFSLQHPSLQTLSDEINRIDTQFILQTKINSVYSAKKLTVISDNTPKREQAKLIALINQNAKKKLKNATLLSTVALKNDPHFNAPVIVSIFLMPGTYWKIILVTPLAVIEDGAKSIANTVWFYLIGIQVIALILLFSFQNKLFIAPISRMVNALNHDNLAVIELESNNRHDEIGLLAKAFSSRTHQLEIALSSLDAINLALEKQLEVQQLAQAQLTENKTQLNLILNSTHSLIFIKNVSGEFTLVNDQFCHAVKLEREHIIGIKEQRIFPQDLARTNSENDKTVITEQQEISYEQVLPSAEGAHTYLITKFPIFNEESAVIAVGTIAFDINQSKHLAIKKQAKFERLQQEKSQNIRSIKQLEKSNQQLKMESMQAKSKAHQDNRYEKVKLDNQTLYPSLVANLIKPIFKEQHELTAKGYSLSNGKITANDFSRELTAQTERLRHLEYLFAGQEYGAKPIDLVQLLEHIIALLQYKFVDSSIEITTESDNRLVIDGIHWHYLVLFYRLINNTLSDAFDVHQTNKRINITLTKQQKQLMITVHDNGLGFSATQLATLQQQMDDNEAYGTLTTLSIWLKTEFDGDISINSLQPNHPYKTDISYRILLS